jgi:hypothetical protein
VRATRSTRIDSTSPVWVLGIPETFLAEMSAERIDHRRDVRVEMGVDTETDLECVDGGGSVCDDGHRCPLVGLNGVGSTRRQPVDKTVMGA